jgi:hypothetical protein
MDSAQLSLLGQALKLAGMSSVFAGNEEGHVANLRIGGRAGLSESLFYTQIGCFVAINSISA